MTRTLRILALVAALFAPSAGFAQSNPAWTVASCPATLGFAAGVWRNFAIDLGGNLCIAGTITVTPSGTQDVNLTKVGGAAIAIGQAAMAASLPIAIASDQSAITVAQGTAANLKAQVSVASGGIASGAVASGAYASGSIASGAVASGAFASGSIGSGAVASGAVASGAYASGSLASGAMVDLVALSAPVAPAPATATKSALLGAQATTSAVNPTNGQQGALSSDTNNNLLVSAGGAPNIATSQASVTTGNITVASARALRRSIKITNVTGTSAIYCGNTGVTTSTGDYLGATAGSNIVLNTTAAVFCTVASVTQTVTVAETY